MDRLIEASMINNLWEVVLGRISAHFIGHYQERVKAKCGEGPSVGSNPVASTSVDPSTSAAEERSQQGQG
jgi:hypothetical protein